MEPLTPSHKKLVLSFIESQNKFKLLTKRKYAYFWTIHNKYLPVEELEYRDTVRVKNTTNIHVHLSNKYMYVKRKK